MNVEQALVDLAEYPYGGPMQRVTCPNHDVLWIPSAWTIWQHAGSWFRIQDGRVIQVKHP